MVINLKKKKVPFVLRFGCRLVFLFLGFLYVTTKLQLYGRWLRVVVELVITSLFTDIQFYVYENRLWWVSFQGW
jgi:cytochrome c biogenesis protein CcdA